MTPSRHDGCTTAGRSSGCGESSEQYSVVEADTRSPVAGPFDDEPSANAVALPMATEPAYDSLTLRLVPLRQ
jgi:hypothetical protein